MANLRDGGEAAVRGQPESSELSCAGRVVVGASAVTDTLLRTAVASVLTVPMLSWARPQNVRRERPRLALYEELAAAADVEATFPAPEAGVAVTSSPAERVALKPSEARV